MSRQSVKEMIVVSAKKSKKRAQKHVSIGRLTPKGLQTLTKRPGYTFRQVCIPSATTLVTSGTGNSYTAASGLLTCGTTNNAPWSLYFRASDLPQMNSTFAALYDQYRIDEIRVTCQPQYNDAYYNGTLTSFYLMNYTAVDFDDSTALTNLTDIFQYDNVQIHEPYKPWSVTLKPRIAVPSGTGFVNIPVEWVDMADITVQHYGLKGFFQSTTSIANFYYFIVEYVISMRSVR